MACANVGSPWNAGAARLKSFSASMYRFSREGLLRFARARAGGVGPRASGARRAPAAAAGADPPASDCGPERREQFLGAT